MKTVVALCLTLSLLPLTLLAQKTPPSATLTNPGSKTFMVPKNPTIPPVLLSCLMSNGKPRPFPCEFALIGIEIVGKNGVSLGKITPTKNSITLPRSKASSDVEAPGGKSAVLGYLFKLRYRRVQNPAFSTAQYVISTGTVDNPSTPSELKVLHTFADKPGKLPGAVQEYAFIVSLPCSTGSSPTLNAPIKYLQIANPVTFEKVKSPMNKLSDRAEAAMSIFLSVDFKQ